MTTTYEYVRNRLAKGYDLETVADVVGETITFEPAAGIASLFPAAKFKLFGEDIKFLCVFEEALSAPEEIQLDNYIASYRT